MTAVITFPSREKISRPQFFLSRFHGHRPERRRRILFLFCFLSFLNKEEDEDEEEEEVVEEEKETRIFSPAVLGCWTRGSSIPPNHFFFFSVYFVPCFFFLLHLQCLFYLFRLHSSDCLWQRLCRFATRREKRWMHPKKKRKITNMEELKWSANAVLINQTLRLVSFFFGLCTSFYLLLFHDIKKHTRDVTSLEL